MKKLVASAVVVACVAAAGTAFAGRAAATGVNFSLHDMNYYFGTVGADSMGRVCVFCHTPHHAQSNLTKPTDTAPLWNHAAGTIVFKPYVWVTPANIGTDDNGSAFKIDDPLIGPSRLCMSCHDGSIAIDEHGKAYAQAGVKQVNARANLALDGAGSDLTTTHPIGFSYTEIRTWRNKIAGVKDPTTGDSEIIDPIAGFATSVSPSEVQGTYNSVLRESKKRIKDVLYGTNNIMTCASCHEVHNKENATQDNYNTEANPTIDDGQTDITGKAPNYFLYAKQSGSLICLSCHVK